MSSEDKGEETVLDVSAEVPKVEGELDETVVQARDLMNTLVKTIKAHRLYPPENPTVAGFSNQLFSKFHNFLNKYHSFVFQVGEYTLSFKGKILYENSDLKSSLAFHLYKDGLREIRFIEGLEQNEVQSLIEILSQVEQINRMEDDLVTLMWERDFVHMSYLATDEFLEEVSGIIPETVEQFRTHLVFEPPAQNVAIDLHDDHGGTDLDFQEILERVNIPPSIVANRSVYFLTPDELERLRKEVENEIAPTFVFNVIDILFEIITLEKEEEPYQDSVNLLQKLFDALLTLGEFKKASDLLTRVNIMLKTHELKDWQVHSIQRLADSAGDAQRIERIGNVLEKGKNIRLEELGQYLLLLRSNAIQPLIQVLGTLSNSKARRIICDTLCHIGKNSIELIIPFVDDTRWYLVRNILYVLGRIGKEQAIPAIQRAFQHKEPRVRREAIQALGLVGGTKALEILVKALSDEDGRIRGISALCLARVGKRESQPYLLEIMQSKEFAKRDNAEKKAFMDALKITAPDEDPASLQKLVEKKPKPMGEKKGEVRIKAESPPPQNQVSKPVTQEGPRRSSPQRPAIQGRFMTARRQTPVARRGFRNFFKKCFGFLTR